MDALPYSQALACENASGPYFHRQKSRSSHKYTNPGNLLNGLPGFVDDRGFLCQGFSIREYVGKVRSVNFRKCWPFSESLLEDNSRQNLLPPLNRPCYRWWACQHCEGEHERFGTSFHRQEPENHTSKIDRIIDRQMTVSLGDLDPCISQDLDEQIQKLSRVQISGQDDNTVETENGIRVENKTRNVYGYRQSSLGPPFFRAASWNIGTLKSSSHSTREGKAATISNISNVEVSAVKVCPVCKTFTSTTITAVNAHIDDCLAQASNAEKKEDKMQKHKSRRQKKRSIVDICAVAPPVQCHLDPPENLGMRESDVSAAPNCKLKKSKVPIQTGLGNAICDELASFNCKRKRATQAHSLTQMGKAANGKAKSAEKKRKRQPVGISKRVKELKMSSAATHSKNTDHGVEHHLKHSSTEEDSRDSNVEKPPSMEGIPMQNCDLMINQHRQPGNVMDHTQTESMLPAEDRAREGSISNNSAQAEQSAMLLQGENTGEPSSILRMAKATSDVSHSYVMRDTVPPRTDLSLSDNEKSNLLGDNECRPRKAYITDDLRLQVQETSKPEDPNLLNLFNENPLYKKVTSLYPGKAGEHEQSDGIYTKSERIVVHSLKEECPPVQTDLSDQQAEPVNSESGFEFVAQTEGNNAPQDITKHKLGDLSNSSCIQSFDWEKGNSKVLHSLQNGKLILETRKVTGGCHIRNARLDLNKKACVIPRDSKGRFLSSHSMDGPKQGDILYSKCNQTTRRKSTKPPKSLLNTSAMKKETSHVEARLSENTKEVVKLSIHADHSDYGYIGLPLDSQGELVKHISNTRPGFNQLYKIPNYTVVNEPFSQGTKTNGEFNFVGSSKTRHDATSVNQPLQMGSFKCLPQQNYSIQCKQPDSRQEYSVSKTKRSNHFKRGPEHSSMLDQAQRDKMYRGSSHIRIASSSIGTPDTISMLPMQATVQSEYNGDQNQEASVLEKTYPETDITKWKQLATQPVMRLMGQSFAIGGENEGRNALKHPQQCNTKDAISTKGTTVCVPSSMQRMTTYIHRCISCNKGQFDLPWLGSNTLCQHCRGKANISKSIQDNFKKTHSEEMSSIGSIAGHEDRTLNNNAPQVEKRLLTNNFLHGHSLKDQCYSGQAWTSRLPSSAPIANMLISPVRDFRNTTFLNKGHKMEYNDSSESNQSFPAQKQTYSQLLNSCLEKHTFQKPDCNGWTYTNNPCSPPIRSDVVQSLSCPINSLRNLPGSLHSFTCGLAHSTSFPTEKQSPCQTPSSYTSIADSSTLLMPGKCIYASINLAESEKLIQNLPENMSTNGCEIRHEKVGVTDAFNIDRKCRDDSRKAESVKDTEGLLGKWISGKHEDSVAGSMQRSDPL